MSENSTQSRSAATATRRWRQILRPALRNHLVLFGAAIIVLMVLLAALADLQEVQAAAELLLDNLLAGFNDGDYPRYSRDFDQMLKEAIPAAKFQQVRGDILKKLGKYQARQYLGFLSQGQFTVVLWKGGFAATDNDVLIKLAVSKRLDRTVVTGLWFQ